jgi:soluble P-type ATPase
MIRLEIPGLGVREIAMVITDYTGTHAFAGAVRPGVKARLAALARQTEIHVLTADTFGTARRELTGLPVVVHVLAGGRHDEQKRAYVLERDPQHVAAFGNGNNDRLLLKAVHEAGGLAIAVDNGEGCALDAILAADLLIHGSENALDLLLDPDRCRATLRF